MKLHHHCQPDQGMTLVEIVLVVSIFAFFSMMLLPLLAQSKRKTHPYTCTNDIKQTLLAYKVWAGDHNDKYPMEVSVTNGGTLELMNTPDAWRTFQVMSNELSTPKIIHCPQDSKHSFATNFTDGLKGKISYLIAASATDTDPQLFLSGDDNFLVNQKPVQPGLIDPASTGTLKWDGERHGGYTVKQGWFNEDKKIGCGNIGLTDGSVQSCTDSGLTNYLAQAYQATNRLIIP